MNLKTKTPRTEMVMDAIVNKMVSIFDGVSEEIGLDKEVVDKQLTRFATLSARVEHITKGEIDFEFAQPTDTPEEIRVKFMRYIDTSCYQVVDEALGKLSRMDAPLTPREQAPAPLPKDAPKN